MKDPGCGPGAWAVLDGKIWHATSIAGLRGIRADGCIRPGNRHKSSFVSARRWVSLFDFGPSAIDEWNQWGNWAPWFGTTHGSPFSIWLEINREAGRKRFLTPKSLDCCGGAFWSSAAAPIRLARGRGPSFPESKVAIGVSCRQTSSCGRLPFAQIIPSSVISDRWMRSTRGYWRIGRSCRRALGSIDRLEIVTPPSWRCSIRHWSTGFSDAGRQSAPKRSAARLSATRAADSCTESRARCA